MKEDELASAVKGSQLNVIEEEALFLEKATKGQASARTYNHCIGRITTSMFGHVYTCAETKHPTCLDKAIMQYSHVNPTIPWIVIMTTMQEETTRHPWNLSWKLLSTICWSTGEHNISVSWCFTRWYHFLFLLCCCGVRLQEIKCLYKIQKLWYHINHWFRFQLRLRRSTW